MKLEKNQYFFKFIAFRFFSDVFYIFDFFNSTDFLKRWKKTEILQGTQFMRGDSAGYTLVRGDSQLCITVIEPAIRSC